MTMRGLQLIDHYPDGTETRHFCLRIESPQRQYPNGIPGQFFMLQVPEVGEAPFSHVSLPDPHGYFMASIRRVGAVTGALFELEPGAPLGYRGPFGRGWPLLLGVRRLLVVTADWGLAGVAALLDEVVLHHQPPQVRLLYGARDTAAQALRYERERWKSAMPVIETFVEARAGQRGGSLLEHLDVVFAQDSPDVVFASGPAPLMRATAEACLRRGVPAERIWLSVEQLVQNGAGACAPCCLDCPAGPVYRYDRLGSRRC